MSFNVSIKYEDIDIRCVYGYFLLIKAFKVCDIQDKIFRFLMINIPFSLTNCKVTP